jgi:ubiquinone/menaquinone biosynthesis C-methylase UbiE
MKFTNSYSDAERAESYSKLAYPNTYYLAFRDLPAIIFKYVNGKRALDFGCGTGRSTRFLNNLGYDTIGIDISEEMVKKAREQDKTGDYHVTDRNGLSQLPKQSFDLVFSAFTFDNIPGIENRIELMTRLRKLLKHDGIMLLLDSTPELYKNEWASFSTEEFPENRNPISGDIVRVIMKDVDDKRAVKDVIWYDKDYKHCFREAGLCLLESYKPLARENEPFEWINETKVAPWIIYVLGL